MQNSDQNTDAGISQTAWDECGIFFRWLGRIVRQVNTANGWRDPVATKGEHVALIHSEASELLEWIRMGADRHRR